jgi:RNA polymerase sigma-70 factor (ECF subfamily)
MTAAIELVDFFQKYKRPAFHFALQMVGNHDDALDLTQEAFLRLHREWHKQDPARSPVPWLYTVLRNLAIDLLRKRAVHAECDLDCDAPSARPAPDVEAMRSELSARLWEAIARLPLAQREALILKDWHGLSYGEIAQVVGASVVAVTSRLHSARTTLRSQFGRYL